MSRTARTPDADGWIEFESSGNGCFGCSQDNEHGLRMRFRMTGDRAVEAMYTVPDHMRGAPGVVHGGISATLLDEVMGAVTHLSDVTGGDRAVTAEFRLRYQRPTPTEAPLRITAEVVKVEHPNLFLEGKIFDADGHMCTFAEARWRCL